jgi:hypothetical protein
MKGTAKFDNVAAVSQLVSLPESDPLNVTAAIRLSC